MSESINLDPNLRLGDQRRNRYPSPFFDISQQYMPPTMKELFKWCYFYATTNSFVGPALNKIARYPITDLVIESSNKNVKSQYEYFFEKIFKIKSFLMEVNLDLCTYGNAFVTLHYPFTRFVVCRSCKHKEMFKSAKIKITPQLKVNLTCKKCGSTGEAKIHDVTYRSAEKLKPVRINPEQIDIKYNDASGDHIYLYNIPDKLKRMLTSGDTDIFESTPLIYIEAIKQRLKITLNKSNLFHLKRPTVAGKDFGWGIPLLSFVLKDLYYFYTIRRGQEAIINEHISPLDIISPAPNASMDPYQHSNLSSFRRAMQEQINRHRKDPNYKAIMPFPVNHQRIGGDGKVMMLQGEMDFMSKSIIGGMGIPAEFVWGGLTWSGSSVSLRTLENEFLHHRTQLLDLCYWLKDKIRVYMGLSDIDRLRFLDFKMADDIQRLAQIIGLEAAGKISTSTLLTELGYDFEVEQKKRISETDLISKINDKMAQLGAISQGKTQEIQARQQIKMQKLIDDINSKTHHHAQPKDRDQDNQYNEGNVIPLPTASPGQFYSEGNPSPQIEKTITGLAQKILAADPNKGAEFLNDLRGTAPILANLVQAKMNELSAERSGVETPPGYIEPRSGVESMKGVDKSNMPKPMPEQKPPRRAGVI